MRTLSLFSIISVLILSSCSKIDELTQFEMEFEESVVISSTTGINLPFNIITPDIETNSTSTFEGQNTSKDLIEEIVLQELNLTLTDPDNGNFNFLKSIEIYISAEGEETLIAWKNDIANDNLKNLDLETSSADIKKYILGESFKLRLKTITDEVIAQDHHIDVSSVFWVDAKILGQ